MSEHASSYDPSGGKASYWLKRAAANLDCAVLVHKSLFYPCNRFIVGCAANIAHTKQTKTNQQPVSHIMMFSDASSPSCGDYFTIAPHG
jgi:hypothetical protein